MKKACWMTLWMMSAILCVPGLARSQQQSITADYWMSDEIQSKPAAERLKILEAALAVPDWRQRPDSTVRRAIFHRDPSREIKLFVWDYEIQQVAKSWKYLARVESDWLTPEMRKDYELLHGACKIAVNRTQKHEDVIRRTVGYAYIAVRHTPYPEMPAAGQTVSVSWSIGKDNRGRDLVHTMTMDAAQAKNARALFEESLAQLNRVADRDFKPSPKLQDELEAWWARTDAGMVFVHRKGWRDIQQKGYSTIKSPMPAPVLTSTYLGTKGTEWLAGGGFQPDGTVVTAGTSLGPALDFPGIRVRVVGTDVKAPAEPQPQLFDSRSQPGFGWMHPQATPFLVRISSDLKTILAVTRFPWLSGSITSCAVDETGHIYIAGTAGPGLASVSTDVATLESPQLLDGKKEADNDPRVWKQAYVARLNPAADKVLWVRFVQNPNQSVFPPEVRCFADGTLQFTSADARQLTSAGAETLRMDPTIAKAMPDRQRAYDVRRGWLMVATEHHSPTGHEPWRCGYVNLRDRTGTSFLTLYNWSGPFVGANDHLVSDSFFVGSRFGINGDLLLLGNSDGGNSMFNREPLDLLTVTPKMKGLGYSAAGAGATKLFYLIRVSSVTWRVVGGTIFSPGTGVIDYLDAVDNSMLMVMHGRVHLTEDHLCKGLPLGQQILVTDPECTIHRFSSPMLGCGEAQVGRSSWGITSGMVNGRPRALFVTGAKAKAEVYDWDFEVPRQNAMQPDFGGGFLDGHLTVIDLSAPTASP